MADPDIADRLRNHNDCHSVHLSMLDDAADEITRLTAIITQQQADLRTLAGAVRVWWTPESDLHPIDAAIAAAVGRALAGGA